MEPVTWIVGGTLLTLIGGLSGRLWSDKTKVAKSWCQLKHNSMEKLLDTKFGTMKEDLTRIEGKIDKINGAK